MSGHRHNTKFLLFLGIVIVCVTMSGYFFAQHKSTPEFRSKIERVLFEKKNKSPKYILTLPDKKDYNAKPKLEKNQNENVVLKTVEDFVRAAPLVGKLKQENNLSSLEFITNHPDFSEKKQNFILPKIGSNGKKPWIAYGKHENIAPNFYKVAIIFKNIGIDDHVFNAVTKSLPSNVSLSFSPYTVNRAEKISMARKLGHETYMDLLLASKNVLKADNGPLSLGLTASIEENMQRFYKVISAGAPIGGVLVVDGMIDETTQQQVQTAMQELSQRGLLMIDSTKENLLDSMHENNLARKRADIVISEDISPETIQNLIFEAEKIAKTKGEVLIVAMPKPIVITSLKNWIETFSPQLSYEQMKEQNITSIERPFALVPVSNLVVE